MTHKKQRVCRAAFLLLVFAFLLIWFSRVHPLTVYDGDDWYYVSYARRAVPIWRDWNPARVLPEVLMPFCTWLGVHLLMPLTGDYLYAMTLSAALMVSGFITAYTACFGSMMRRLFSLSFWEETFSSVLFLLLHFLALRSQPQANIYLFYCWDYTCYFYYVIPAALCCSLVMTMTANPAFEEFRRNGSPEKKGFFLLALYFGIFSNLPDSVILAVYAGSRLLMDLLKRLKAFCLRDFLRENGLWLGILGAWLLSAVFELSGSRASADMGYDLPLLEGLHETLYGLKQLLLSCNRVFMVLTVAVAAAALVLWLRSREAEPALQLAEKLIGFTAVLIATVVLCAVVDCSYIYRADYLFGAFFYGFLLLMLCFGYLLKKCPGLMTVLPLLLCILTAEINTAGQTFKESNVQNLNAKTCQAVSRDLTEQVIAACEAGEQSLVLGVPVSDSPVNWPLYSAVGERIAASLYEHGITERMISVTVQLDLGMNEKYHIPFPETTE